MYHNYTPCYSSRHLIMMKVISGERGPQTRHHGTVNGACGWSSARARHMVFIHQEGPEETDCAEDSYAHSEHHETTSPVDAEGQPSWETVGDDSDNSLSFENENCEAEHLVFIEGLDLGEAGCSDDTTSSSRNHGIMGFNSQPSQKTAGDSHCSSEDEDHESGPNVHTQEDYSGGEVHEHDSPPSSENPASDYNGSGASVCYDKTVPNNCEGSARWINTPTPSNYLKATRPVQSCYSMEYRWSPMLKYCSPEEVIYQPVHLC